MQTCIAYCIVAISYPQLHLRVYACIRFTLLGSFGSRIAKIKLQKLGDYIVHHKIAGPYSIEIPTVVEDA